MASISIPTAAPVSLESGETYELDNLVANTTYLFTFTLDRGTGSVSFKTTADGDIIEGKNIFNRPLRVTPKSVQGAVIEVTAALAEPVITFFAVPAPGAGDWNPTAVAKGVPHKLTINPLNETPSSYPMVLYFGASLDAITQAVLVHDGDIVTPTDDMVLVSPQQPNFTLTPIIHQTKQA